MSKGSFHEPWTGGKTIRATHGLFRRPILAANTHIGNLKPEYGDRAIECVNACTGINNPVDAVERARRALKECADDLEQYVRNHYEGMLDYPSMKAKHDRDMEPVVAARAALAALGDKP